MLSYSKLSILTFLLLAFNNFIFSQTDANQLQLSEGIMSLNNKPTSQFGSPVLGSSDLYTGMATYQIPLFELKSFSIKVPVSVNYASGGIRVGETGGWLGMTWQLSAGGEISREMKGYPDELPGKGYFVHGDKPTTFAGMSLEDKKNVIKNSQEEGYDMQPDVFHYSFAGESGYFVFDNGQNIHLVPNKNWKKTKTITNNKLVSFSIITDDGAKYIFGAGANSVEETRIKTLNIPGYWDFSGTDVPSVVIEFNKMSVKSDINDFYNSKW